MSESPFFNIFDRIYVINLPERTDRLEETLAVLERRGVRRGDPAVKIFPAIRPKVAGGFAGVGVRGCFESHLQVLKDAQRGARGPVLILEDDVEIADGIDARARLWGRRLREEDWTWANFAAVDGEGLPEGEDLQRLERPVRAAAFYGVNPKKIFGLVAYLEAVMGRPAGHPAGGSMHLDGAYNMFRAQNPEEIVLIAWPRVGWQRSSRSDITPSRLDKLLGDSALAQLFRKLKNRLKRPAQ